MSLTIIIEGIIVIFRVLYYIENADGRTLYLKPQYAYVATESDVFIR